ncbi:hypothetical protein SKAU_G00163230 [Synaphobranchus kaupii]|uniref:Acid-sensing ion channel 2 n=1 Tax=Synaphobranchus kaupii TaxID=118154 RepID=A0A9Q1FIX8_SYNKA|nr:hypothetical protein SKAU_G00163230 [Synaphobranchus kaupii]
MWAWSLQAGLGDDCLSAALGALLAGMALEGPRCPRRRSPGRALALARKGRRQAANSTGQATAAFVARTHLHGLRQVCSPGSSPRHRVLWLLALCTSLGLLLSWSSNRFLYWLSFPTYTKVHMEWAKELTFPGVTICNNNPVRLYKLTKSDLYFAGHWLGLLMANRTARPIVSDLVQENMRTWFHKLSDFRLFLPPRNFEGTSLEFLDRLGHQLDDMLLSCKYRGDDCGPHNFSTSIVAKQGVAGRPSLRSMNPSDAPDSSRSAPSHSGAAPALAGGDGSVKCGDRPADLRPLGFARLGGSFLKDLQPSPVRHELSQCAFKTGCARSHGLM